jgi:hypothetical protein
MERAIVCFDILNGSVCPYNPPCLFACQMAGGSEDVKKAPVEAPEKPAPTAE